MDRIVQIPTVPVKYQAHPVPATTYHTHTVPQSIMSIFNNNPVNPDLCSRILFIFAEYLLGPSGVPPSCAPSVPEKIRRHCELAINELLENPKTMDIHSTLSVCLGTSTAEELWAVLSTLFDESLQSEAQKSEYWLRITNTFGLALVVEAKNQRIGGQYDDLVDLALRHYHKAVRYAIVIDEDAKRSNLVGLLNRSLGDCRLKLEGCIRDPVVVPDSVSGSRLRTGSVALEECEGGVS